MCSLRTLMNEPRYQLCDNYLHNTSTTPTERCRYGRLVCLNASKWHCKVTVKRLRRVCSAWPMRLNMPSMNRTDIHGRRVKKDMDTRYVWLPRLFLWVTLRWLTYVSDVNIKDNSFYYSADSGFVSAVCRIIIYASFSHSQLQLQMIASVIKVILHLRCHTFSG